MNEFFNLANTKIGKLISELSDDAKRLTENTNNEEERGKITMILLYYKLILQGCINFGSDISGFVKSIKDCSMDESDISLILDKYCEKDISSSIINDFELYEKPYVDTEIKPIDELNNIRLEANPNIAVNIKDEEYERPQNDEIDINKEMPIDDTITIDENIELDISDIFSDINSLSNETLVEKENNSKENEINKSANFGINAKDFEYTQEVTPELKIDLDLDFKEEDSNEENYSSIFETLRNAELENSQSNILNVEENENQ